MTYLNFKFDFLKKIEYMLLYLYTIKIVCLYNKIIININRFHVEKIAIFNYFKKKKKVLFRIILFTNKYKCLFCRKFFLIKLFFKKNIIKKIFKYKKKIFFIMGC